MPWFRWSATLNRRRRWDFPIGFLRQRFQFCRRDISGDDKNGVSRRIPTAIKPAQVIDIKAADFMLPANNRATIGIIHKQRRIGMLAKDRSRIVIGALAAFFQNYKSFGFNFFCIKHKIFHPVGFHIHHLFKMLDSDSLEVPGVIKRRKCIFRPADARNNPGKFP